MQDRSLDAARRRRRAGRAAYPGRDGRHGPGAEDGRVLRARGVGGGRSNSVETDRRREPGAPGAGGRADGSTVGGGATHQTLCWSSGCAMTAATRRPGPVWSSAAASSYADPASGLTVDARARMLAAHADADYEEWGASATVRLDPGETRAGALVQPRRRPSARRRARRSGCGVRGDARGLAPGGAFEAARGPEGRGRLRHGAPWRPLHRHAERRVRDVERRGARLPARLAAHVCRCADDPGFEVSLDAVRREAANDDGPPEHGVMLRSLIRW